MMRSIVSVPLLWSVEGDEMREMWDKTGQWLQEGFDYYPNFSSKTWIDHFMNIPVSAVNLLVEWNDQFISW